MKSTRLMAFETVWSMPKSQQQVSCQGSTTWFCGKITLRKRIPGSLYWQSSTFKDSLTPITKTIQKGHQQPFSLSIQLHQWRGPWRLQQTNMVDLLSLPPLLSSDQKSFKPLSSLIFSGFSPPSPIRVERFFTKHTWDLPVFLFRLLLELGNFSPNTLRIFRFSFSVSHWVRRFFH